MTTLIKIKDGYRVTDKNISTATTKKKRTQERMKIATAVKEILST